MGKFKEGAKARIVVSGYTAPKFCVGDVGRVYETEEITGMFCPEGHNPNIEHNHIEGTLCFPLSHLELIEEGRESEVTAPEVQPNVQGGIKFDQGKVRYTLLLQDLPRAVKQVTEVLEFGAKKYARMNFEKIEAHRYDEAMTRHLMAYLAGEENDPESGKNHLSHMICCAMFLLEREIKKGE